MTIKRHKRRVSQTRKFDHPLAYTQIVVLEKKIRRVIESEYDHISSEDTDILSINTYLSSYQ